jgi:hypothetical protein
MTIIDAAYDLACRRRGGHESVGVAIGGGPAGVIKAEGTFAENT